MKRRADGKWLSLVVDGKGGSYLDWLERSSVGGSRRRVAERSSATTLKKAAWVPPAAAPPRSD